MEEENKYDIGGIMKTYKISNRKISGNGVKQVSKRNLANPNGKNRKISGTPSNYDSKKRLSQPVGFGKK